MFHPILTTTSRTECPACAGSGEIEYEFVVYRMSGPNELDTKFYDCERCDGTGEVVADEVDF